MKDNINKFSKSLDDTNMELSDLIDVEKIDSIINNLEIKLNTLNYIISISKEEMNIKIKHLYQDQPDVFLVLPYLVAISKDKIKKKDYKFKYDDRIWTLNNFLLLSKNQKSHLISKK